MPELCHDNTPVKLLRISLPLAAFAALLIALGNLCRADDLPVVGWQGKTMGTGYSVRLVDPKLPPEQVEALKKEIEGRLEEINRQMSNYIPDSEVSRFNRAPVGEPFKVSPEFASVVRFALDLSRRSGGAFDPTLGPVIKLWGFGEGDVAKAVPPQAKLEAAMKNAGWKHLSVTAEDELIKDIPGLTINLGGVGKGYGTDEIVKLLRARGLTNAYVSIAGEVMVLGRSPRGDKWRLGISAPVDQWRENDPMAAGVSLTNYALSTSGDYQKFFLDAEGRRMSHIIDPKTGSPVRHMLGGVSVVAPDSMTADALGTTLFVLGPEKGMEFIDKWENAAALFIVRQADGSFRKFSSKRFAELTAP